MPGWPGNNIPESDDLVPHDRLDWRVFAGLEPMFGCFKANFPDYTIAKFVNQDIASLVHIHNAILAQAAAMHADFPE